VSQDRELDEHPDNNNDYAGLEPASAVAAAF
jgi:hypothetical protein